eukprot:5491861-Amphidinium_carterae.1
MHATRPLLQRPETEIIYNSNPRDLCSLPKHQNPEDSQDGTTQSVTCMPLRQPVPTLATYCVDFTIVTRNITAELEDSNKTATAWQTCP